MEEVRPSVKENMLFKIDNYQNQLFCMNFRTIKTSYREEILKNRPMINPSQKSIAIEPFAGMIPVLLKYCEIKYQNLVIIDSSFEFLRPPSFRRKQEESIIS